MSPEDRAAAAIDTAFAICSAFLYDLPECDHLISSLDAVDARLVIRALGHLQVGQLQGLERHLGLEPGTILRRVVARYHQCRT